MHKKVQNQERIKQGDWVISTEDNEYKYLIGIVISVEQHGSLEHNTGNETDDIHVDFTVYNYPKPCIEKIEQQFSNLYGEPIQFDELSLDDVIMAPEMLVHIKQSKDEMDSIMNASYNCYSDYVKAILRMYLLQNENSYAELEVG